MVLYKSARTTFRPRPCPKIAGTAPEAKADVPGLLKPGNIDVNHRPAITNADGSHSTIFSATIPLGNGQWALIPTIVGGKFLTPDGKMPLRTKKALGELEDRAREQYETSGEHLGIFNSLKEADAYAEATHAYMPDGTNREVYVAPHTPNR